MLGRASPWHRPVNGSLLLFFSSPSLFEQMSLRKYKMKMMKLEVNERGSSESNDVESWYYSN